LLAFSKKVTSGALGLGVRQSTVFANTWVILAIDLPVGFHLVERLAAGFVNRLLADVYGGGFVFGAHGADFSHWSITARATTSVIFGGTLIPIIYFPILSVFAW
jgi:nucleoside permease NupC